MWFSFTTQDWTYYFSQSLQLPLFFLLTDLDNFTFKSMTYWILTERLKKTRHWEFRVTWMETPPPQYVSVGVRQTLNYYIHTAQCADRDTYTCRRTSTGFNNTDKIFKINVLCKNHTSSFFKKYLLEPK